MYSYAVYKYYIRSLSTRRSGKAFIQLSAAYAHRLVLDNITMSKVLL